MSRIDLHRTMYEHEKAANERMLGMLESVPEDRRDDERFQKAVTLVAHLAACRENWLDRMINDSAAQTDWWPTDVAIGGLRERYAVLERRWTDYHVGLRDEDLDVDFEFPIGGGKRYRWNVEGQIVQMAGHGPYHRGQVAPLVDQLGGAMVDTDYLYWATMTNPERWKVVE